MCGIFALLDPNLSAAEIETLTKLLTKRLHHRGPDEVGYHGGPGYGLGHARLSIMDPAGGHQPLIDQTTGAAVIVNGEIYNHEQIRAEFKNYPFYTTSDSETVLPQFRDKGANAIGALDGMFATVVASADGTTVVAGRDPCGIKPLYRGWSANGRVAFASELKCLVGYVEQAEEFPCGHYWTRETGYTRYFNPSWLQPVLHPERPLATLPSKDTSLIRERLKMAVQKRLMSDVGYGLLLSGGLDSAIVCKLMSELTDMSKIKTFTVGMPNSPDIMAAREVSKVFGTDHHEHLFSPRDAFEIIPQVVYHLETYEPELIRSSIPNFFLARLASKHTKVVLTGEGADELFAGYLYFKDCPDAEAMQRETLRIWDHLHNVNLQRSDRMSMAHSLEARVPFLDVEVLKEAYGVDPNHKMIDYDSGRMEKYALRALFDGDLPNEIVWRTKAMQCEGVGTDWVSLLQGMCAEVVTDAELAVAAETYPINPPQSKEELYYRRLFETHFPGMSKFVHVWEGGCRAGGAAWQSSMYTRAGLADTERLKHGLMDGVDVKTEAGTGRKLKAGTTLPSPETAPPDALAVQPVPETASAFEMALVSRGDARLTLTADSTGTLVNQYFCPPRPIDGAINRGSCTCSPPTPSGVAHASDTWDALCASPTPTARAAAFGAQMASVRSRLAKAMSLPEGTAVVLAASGTDAEYVPIALLRELYPKAPIHSVLAADEEVGSGGPAAASAKHFCKKGISPFAPTPLAEGTPLEGFGTVTYHAVPARTKAGAPTDHAAALTEIIDAVEAAGGTPPAYLLRQVVGTKTGVATSLPPNLPRRSIVVCDLCQLRAPFARVRELLALGHCVLVTGSKFFEGAAFSGAVLVPRILAETVADQAAAAAAAIAAEEETTIPFPPPLPSGMGAFFSQYEIPPELEHWRPQLHSTPNEGLLLRWLTALPQIERVAAIEPSTRSELEAAWTAKIRSLVAAAPHLSVVHSESAIVSISCARADGGTYNKDELKKVHKWMTSDLGPTAVGSTSAEASTRCYIGQPVKLSAETSVLRIALGGATLAMLAEGADTGRAEETVVQKLSWCVGNYAALSKQA